MDSDCKGMSLRLLIWQGKSAQHLTSNDFDYGQLWMKISGGKLADLSGRLAFCCRRRLPLLFLLLFGLVPSEPQASAMVSMYSACSRATG